MGWYANQKERNEAYKAQKALEKKAALERGEPSTWDNIKSKAKESMDKAGAIADQQKAKKKELDDQGIPYLPKMLINVVKRPEKRRKYRKGSCGWSYPWSRWDCWLVGLVEIKLICIV